jgi:hypothetical protein
MIIVDHFNHTKFSYMFVFHFNVIFWSLQMTSSTLANLVENSNNLPLGVGREHWTFSTQEDKYLCVVNGAITVRQCTSISLLLEVNLQNT